MALFGKKNSDAPGAGAGNAIPEMLPLEARKAYCQICAKEQKLSRCWQRNVPVKQCPCCGLIFQNVPALYNLPVPMCPQCKEPLEQPYFDYGLCDGCGSKYEIVPGTKPGLLPNKQQRAEMAKFGTAKNMY